MIRSVRLTTGSILDMGTFHAASQAAFGFPAFYGRNLDAWIDCMSDLRDGTGMTNIKLGRNELLAIEVPDSAALRQRCPDVVDALVDCVGAVNQRFLTAGQPAALALIFC